MEELCIQGVHLGATPNLANGAGPSEVESNSAGATSSRSSRSSTVAAAAGAAGAAGATGECECDCSTRGIATCWECLSQERHPPGGGAAGGGL
jgi:hypothetical protein